MYQHQQVSSLQYRWNILATYYKGIRWKTRSFHSESTERIFDRYFQYKLIKYYSRISRLKHCNNSRLSKNGHLSGSFNVFTICHLTTSNITQLLLFPMQLFMKCNFEYAAAVITSAVVPHCYTFSCSPRILKWISMSKANAIHPMTMQKTKFISHVHWN